MESVYASLLLHKTGQKLNEENLEKVLEAAGAKVDKAKLKATLAALEGINIDEALKSAAFTAVAAPEGAGAGKKEEKKKEEEKKEEETVAGLSALFG